MPAPNESIPLFRVEGHGRVTVKRDGNRVAAVEVIFYEAPRLFEALVVGKRFDEIPDIVCRICSICSTVHKVTALQAVEGWAGVDVPPEALLTRELAVLGGIIESHALHLACLVLPDVIGIEGLAAVAKRDPLHLKLGLALKEGGNLLQEAAGGRAIHPVNLVSGGVRLIPPRPRLRELLAAVRSLLPRANEFRRFFDESGRTVPQLSPPRHAAFTGNRIEVTGWGSFPAAEYRKHLVEETLSESNAKRSLLDGRPVATGAISRAVIAGTAAGGTDFAANPAAQAAEIVDSLRRAAETIDELLGSPKVEARSAVTAPGAGSGTAAVEAPRGILIHSYRFDDAGTCVAADVVTPTAINQAPLEEDLNRLAAMMEGATDGELTGALERLVRAYDPCISCAVHIVQL